MADVANKRDFLDLSDAGTDAIAAMLDDAHTRKAARTGWPKGRVDADRPLDGFVLAMVFEKSSTRTRVSFDIAMRQLGGSVVVLESATSQLGRGESIADTARVLSRMADAIMIRTDDHTKITQMARHASVPVVNGLTDRSHPCQIVADLLTILENGKTLPGLKVAWFGDGNNVLHSIVEAAGLTRFDLAIATPAGYQPQDAFIAEARRLGARITATQNAADAARDADVVVTDTWVSMGQGDADEDFGAKRDDMNPFRVTTELMALARKDAIFLHCLPAHVGEEVTADVFESPRSRVFDQAENRIHAQKSILLWTLGRL